MNSPFMLGGRDVQLGVERLRDQMRRRRGRCCSAARGGWRRLRDRLLQRGEPDSARTVRRGLSSRCEPHSAPAPARFGGRCSPRASCSARSGAVLGVLLARPLRDRRQPLCRASRCAPSTSPWIPACCGSAPLSPPTAAIVLAACRGCLPRRIRPDRNWRAAAFDHAGHEPPYRARSPSPRSRCRSCCSPAPMLLSALVALQHTHTGYCGRYWRSTSHCRSRPSAPSRSFYQEAMRRIEKLPGVGASPSATSSRGATPGTSAPVSSLPPRGIRRRIGGESAPGFEHRTPASSLRRRPDRRRPRLHRRRSRRQGTRGHREPERRAAAVPDGDALNHRVWWTDPYFGKPAPRRIVGVVADVWTMRTWCRAWRSRSITRSGSWRRPGGCSCTRRAIHTRWSRR